MPRDVVTGGTQAERQHVVILIDALGWEIVQRFGFARDLLPHRNGLDTILGYSSAAIPSLLSGTVPSQHGTWAMYRYAPDRSPFRALRMLPRLPHALEWRLRRLIRRVVDRRKSVRGYYELYEIPPKLLGYFDVATRDDPYTPGSLRTETLFDRLNAEGVPFRQWNYRSPERSNFEELVASIGSERRMLFLYTAELDALMHRVGIFHEDVRRKLAWYESQLSAIQERAKAAEQPLALYVFSDHGMTDVSKVVDLMHEVERWGFHLGRDFVAFYDSTMARFWCRRPIRAELSGRLGETGWGRVVTEAELDKFGCRFEDASYGEVIFLLEPGNLIVPSFMARAPVAAMHGYDPEDRFSKGCFLTNVARGKTPESILDLKSHLLEQIVGQA